MVYLSPFVLVGYTSEVNIPYARSASTIPNLRVRLIIREMNFYCVQRKDVLLDNQPEGTVTGVH